MNINLPPKLRLAIYITNGIGSIIVIYLATKGIVGDPETVAWASYSLFTSGLAGYNVDVKE